MKILAHIKKLFLALGLTSIACFANAAVFLGPTPYLSASDSPFSGGNFDYFHLEDFEDQSLNTPGVSASSGNITSLIFPGVSNTDSVDADDGVIDGSGLNGDSFFNINGSGGITFTFDIGVLGTLPTHVGIVWTDGAGTTSFEAFDSNNSSLGGIGPVSNATNGFVGQTDEDRFFGVTHSSGISSIFISNTVGGIEVDHLQYGLASPAAVPLTSTLFLLVSGFFALISLRRFA